MKKNMLLKKFAAAAGQICNRTAAFAKEFIAPEIFFTGANVVNFSQAANPIVTDIALANLAYTGFQKGITAVIKQLPEESKTRIRYNNFTQSLHDKTPTKNLLKHAFRLVGCEISDPLRVVGYCGLVMGGFMLVGASGGAAAGLFPGLAALSFSLGNMIQSSPTIQGFREAPKTPAFLKAITHPALYYGLGYVMTGIGIGGGLALFHNPLGNVAATVLTAVGATEILGTTGLIASEKIQNQAAPFVAVALGTAIIGVTGIVTDNTLGAATGFLACGGELTLAVIMQQLHNAAHADNTHSASRIEQILTSPIRQAMKLGWIAPTPLTT